MPTFRITKVVRHDYEVTADSESDALSAPLPAAQESITVLEQKARNLDKKSVSPVKVITDRTLRPRRAFRHAYKSDSFVATVLPGGRIELAGDGIDTPIVLKNLQQAAQIAAALASGTKRSVNVYAFWKEQAAEPE